MSYTRHRVTLYEHACSCERCGHEWLSIGKEPPTRCPACKTHSPHMPPDSVRPGRPMHLKVRDPRGGAVELLDMMLARTAREWRGSMPSGGILRVQLTSMTEAAAAKRMSVDGSLIQRAIEHAIHPELEGWPLGQNRTVTVTLDDLEFAAGRR